MSGPKFQYPDIYRGSHLTVLASACRPPNLKFSVTGAKFRCLGHPLISSPALDDALDGTLDDVLDGGLDGALHGEHYFAIEGALDGALDREFDGDFDG